MEKLRVPQVRILQALKDGAALTRQGLSEKAGFSTLSGTVTRVLNGLREGSSSGAAHPGLLAMGLLTETELDVDGLKEVVYSITPRGKEALAQNGLVPDMRSRDSCINKRYRG